MSNLRIIDPLTGGHIEIRKPKIPIVPQ